jgi:hypothetical protein
MHDYATGGWSNEEVLHVTGGIDIFADAASGQASPPIKPVGDMTAAERAAFWQWVDFASAESRLADVDRAELAVIRVQQSAETVRASG